MSRNPAVCKLKCSGMTACASATVLQLNGPPPVPMKYALFECLCITCGGLTAVCGDTSMCMMMSTQVPFRVRMARLESNASVELGWKRSGW